MASGPHIGGAYQPDGDYTRTGATDTGGTYASPTLTSATLSGTTAIGSGATLTSPTIASPTVTAPVVSGAGSTTGQIFSDYKVLAASVTYTANVVAATITGFSWTVAAAGTYIFEVNLPTTMTTNGGLAVSFKLTTATLASIQYQTYAATASDNTTAVSTNGTTTTDATKMFDDKTAAYTHVNIKGSFVTTLGGTFAIQGCQNTSAGGGDATVVLIGSYAKLTRVA